MNRMIVWAMMLIATIETTALSAVLCVLGLASCSSDNDGNDTLSANDKAQMYGHYQSLAIYGDNITTSAIDVNVSEDHVKFTVPVEQILPSVMSEANGLDEAVATVKVDDVEDSYTLVRYYNNIASFSVPAQTVNFTYKVGGAKQTGNIKLSTPSFSYNTSTKMLNIGYTIETVTLNGQLISSYKKRVMRMKESDKKD